MPGPKAPQISLSPDERQGLAGLIRAHKTPQHLSFRARSFSTTDADGQNMREVADGLSTLSRLSQSRRWTAPKLARPSRRLSSGDACKTPASRDACHL